jgi:hypothetical protein
LEEFSQQYASLATRYSHQYFVIGSFTAKKPLVMTKVKDEEGVFEISAKLGQSGFEEFAFCRDADLQQLIYPSARRTEAVGVHACGPDHLGTDKFWVIHGQVDELFKLRLEVDEGKITVKLVSQRNGEKVWETLPGPDRHSYCVSGTWNDFKPEPMVRDENAPIWRFAAFMGQEVSMEFRSFYELFNIQVDGDPNICYYPLFSNACREECLVEGPGPSEGDHLWVVKGPHAGAPFEIVFDPKATDRRKIVTWNWARKPVYDFRGGSLQLTMESGNDAALLDA